LKNDEINIDELYPWGGDFTSGDFQNNVGLISLNINYIPSYDIAIYGKLKTENIGIEKIIANVISNPFIRFIIICGSDIRGHQSGKSLICLHKHGIDDNNRIIDAPGAIPYIENINEEAIERFQSQIEILDLVDVNDKKIIDKKIKECIAKSPSSFGEPYIAIRITPEIASLDDKRALHSKVVINYMGKVEKRGD